MLLAAFLAQFSPVLLLFPVVVWCEGDDEYYGSEESVDIDDGEEDGLAQLTRLMQQANMSESDFNAFMSIFGGGSSSSSISTNDSITKELDELFGMQEDMLSKLHNLTSIIMAKMSKGSRPPWFPLWLHDCNMYMN